MVIDQYVQQWSAIQTARAARLTADDVFMAYFALSGSADEFHIEGYLSGLIMLSRSQRDMIAQAVNESMDGTGSTADGAHYSDGDIAQNSGYEAYLRTLTLSPDVYDFTAPPLGDHSTSTTAVGNETSTTTIDDLPTKDLFDEAEFRRCEALYDSGLLESGAEERFDRITRLARDHFNVSSASIALITEDTQVIKSVTGPLGQDLPRNLSLCATTIQQDRTFVITDAGVHPQWRHHPLVAGGPGVRFYAGHPLTTIDGWRIGTLCLMDDQPRTFTPEDMEALKRLALEAQVELWI